MGEYRALGPDDRALKLIEPATRILELSPEELERLAIGDVAGMQTGPLEELSGSKFPLQTKLSFSLYERWVECARTQGEDLCGAILQLFDESSVPSLDVADPTLIELACQGLHYYMRDPQGVRRMGPPLLSALRGLRGEDADWDTVFPVVGVLAGASWIDPILREELLELVEAPWLSGHRRSTFLLLIAHGGTYEEWRVPLDNLLRSKKGADTKWAAVEVLRSITAGTPGGPQQVAPEVVSEAIPDTVLRDPVTSLRWAAFELLAGYGGNPGQQRLLALLQDPTAPDRASVLGFLALEGLVDADLCEQFIDDEDPALRQGAVQALGALARTDRLSYDKLRDLALNDPDPKMRQDAVRSLSSSKQPAALEDLLLASRDVDDAVQVEAVLQIGLLDVPEELGSIATDVARAPEARGVAFQEWLKDAPDEAVPGICQRMYEDGDPDIQAEGYLWKAALALGSADPDAAAEWEALPIPSALLSKSGILPESLAGTAVAESMAGAFDGTIRDKIKAEINSQLGALRSPHMAERLAQHHSLLASSPGLAADHGMSKLFEVQERMLLYLNAQGD